MPGRALRPRASWRIKARRRLSESSSCPEGHYDEAEPAARWQNPRRHYRNHPHARKGITTVGFAQVGSAHVGKTSESSSCPEGHYDVANRRLALEHSSGSESSSCPEGHYDWPTRSITMSSPSLSESSSCPEGHYDIPARAPHLLYVVHRNHPHARKGITTERSRRTDDVAGKIHRNHPHARKGITTAFARRVELRRAGHRNHPHARKGITTEANQSRPIFSA